MRVVATDEYGQHILQGLSHVDMNEKILMAMMSIMSTMTTMTRMKIILTTMMMTKCVVCGI